MTKPTEEKAMPEALATFAASARNNNVPAGQGVLATPETSGKPGPRRRGKDAADIIGGNATADKNRVDAAIDHHAKADKRAG